MAVHNLKKDVAKIETVLSKREKELV
jgi:ribosomal protein L29